MPPICRLSRLDEGDQAFDCLPLHGWQYRAVDVEGDGDAGMAEPLLDHFGMDARPEQGGGVKKSVAGPTVVPAEAPGVRAVSSG